MRAGRVGLDVAQWAGQVVERYGEIPESAGLRASLPILRRCAGLCPQCGLPYKGLEAACPRCLHPQTLADAPPPPDEPEPELAEREDDWPL